MFDATVKSQYNDIWHTYYKRLGFFFTWPENNLILKLEVRPPRFLRPRIQISIY